MLKIANYHNVIELWAVSLSKPLGIEPVEYTSDRFFSVRAHDIEQGVNFYRYQVQIADGAGNLFYTRVILG